MGRSAGKFYGRRIGREDQAKAYAEAVGPDALARQQRAAASRCKSCHKPIRWALTNNNRRMPVDYDEHEGGNVFLFQDGSCRTGRQDEATPAGATRHYSHFVTCPDASQHRSVGAATRQHRRP